MEGSDLSVIQTSCAGYEEFLVWLIVGFVGGCVAGYVLNELATALRTFAFNYAHAARGHGAGFESEDAAVANHDVRAKPVGAEHSSRGVEGH